MIRAFAARNRYSVSQAIRECVTYTVENEQERAKRIARALRDRRARRASR